MKIKSKIWWNQSDNSVSKFQVEELMKSTKEGREQEKGNARTWQLTWEELSCSEIFGTLSTVSSSSWNCFRRETFPDPGYWSTSKDSDNDLRPEPWCSTADTIFCRATESTVPLGAPLPCCIAETVDANRFSDRMVPAVLPRVDLLLIDESLFSITSTSTC